MTVITDQIDELAAKTETGMESTDPAYLKWRDEKVTAALADSRENPHNRIPQSEVWKKFGLES